MFLSAPQANKGMLGAQSSLLESISDDDLEPSSSDSSSQDGSTENLTVRPSVVSRRNNQQDIENTYFIVSLSFFIYRTKNKVELLRNAVSHGDMKRCLQSLFLLFLFLLTES